MTFGAGASMIVVRRFIDGAWRRFVEKLETRQFGRVEDVFFVDSGLSYSGAAVDEIYGLEHLEDEDVCGLVDGNVVRGLKVQGGKVTLPYGGSKIHLGLEMEAMIETLPLDLGEVKGLGTVQGRMKSVAKVTLRVEKTRGIWTGARDDVRDGDGLVEYKQRSVEAWNEAIKLYTGDIEMITPWDWNKSGSVVVKQFDPLPMTILGIMPDVTLGR